MRPLFLSVALAFAGVLSAQTCGSLAITGSGAAGTQLGVAVTGATANAFTIVLVGETTGTTSLPLPGGSLSIGLASPFLPLPLGRTDATGAASQQINVPSWISQQYSLNAQAVTIGFTRSPFSISGCTTNVAAFTIG